MGFLTDTQAACGGTSLKDEKSIFRADETNYINKRT